MEKSPRDTTSDKIGEYVLHRNKILCVSLIGHPLKMSITVNKFLYLCKKCRRATLIH